MHLTQNKQGISGNSRYYQDLLNEVLNTIGTTSELQYYPWDNLHSLIRKKTFSFFLFFCQHLFKRDLIKLDSEYLQFLQTNSTRFSNLYENLADDKSRNQLIKFQMYKIFGDTKSKMPLNQKAWKNQYVQKVKECTKVRNGKKINHHHLSLFNYEIAGFQLKFWGVSSNLINTFVSQQYKYSQDNLPNPVVSVEAGDVVFDAGVCWGDSLLYLGALAGPKGKVIGFEFDPNNLKILEENIDLNKISAFQFQIIKKALWHTENETLVFDSDGPATTVGKKSSSPSGLEVPTTTIDAVACELSLNSVDFIKMDIEGAELDALKGGLKTIEKYHPKMAISIYHRKDDPIEIFEIINRNFGGYYDYYIEQFTVYDSEVILFFKPKVKNC